MRPIPTLALALSLLLPAHASARTNVSSERRAPVAATADAPALERAAELLAGSSCRERLLQELRTGSAGAPGCEGDRRRLGRALAGGRRFGYVERSDVQLWAIDLVLGEALRCREWPVRGQDRAVLDPRDVSGAGCRPRRYRGAVEVTLVDAEGGRARLPALTADRDGRLRVVIAELDAAARFAGLGEIRRWAWIELGTGAWAGRIDLRALHEFLADWHSRWIRQGRGAPALFAVRHPEHAVADEARALAVEARLARERADMDEVKAGRMSPRRFLSRHPGSAYRREMKSRAAR